MTQFYPRLMQQELVDQETGFHDGISFAYQFGTHQLNQDQLQKFVLGKSDWYKLGFAEGFAFIRTQETSLPHV